MNCSGKEVSSTPRSARLVLTFDCNRKCSYCVNSKPGIIDKAIPISNMDELNGYDAICLTGGEPMLHPELVIGIARYIKLKMKPTKAYLYLSYFDREEDMRLALTWLDGITYAMHEYLFIEDLWRLHLLHELLMGRRFKATDRLRLNSKLRQVVSVIPALWSDARLDVMRDDCGIPPNETLYIWKT